VPLQALAEGPVLEEIVVTAPKRDEVIQEIPMSVQAISGDTLEASGITEFEGLSATVPNFSASDGLVTSVVVMRGIGSGTDRGFEQSVGMFIDGVYMPRSRQYRSPFMDTEMVEVLRGPQAVLYGLNSTAGSIIVTTRKSRPGDEFEASLTGEYETEYGGYLVRGIAGGSLSDNFAMRLALQTNDSGDGTEINSVTGLASNIRDQDLARLTAVYEPTETLSFEFKYEVVDFETQGSYGEAVARKGFITPEQFAAAGLGDGIINRKQSFYDSLLPLLGIYETDRTEAGSQHDSTNASLRMDYDLSGGHTLSLIGGYSDFSYDSGSDVMNIEKLSAFQAYFLDDYQQYTGEIQFSSPGDQVVDYIIGGFYLNSDLLTASGLALNGALLSAIPGDPYAGMVILGDSNLLIDQNMWSVYGNATWNITDKVRLVGGLRYVEDDKDADRPAKCNISSLDGTYVDDLDPAASAGICSPVPDYQNARSSGNLMPEIVIQYDMTDDLMTYAKWSESVKSGGFAAAISAPEETIEFDDETAQGFEAGLKSSLAGGAAELNVALFYVEVEDMQLNAYVDTGGPIQVAAITNAGKSITQGLELDGRWAANEWLTLGGALAWTDATYDDFKNGPCSRTISIVTGENICDLSGQDLPLAPEWSASIFADTSFLLSNGMLLEGGAIVSYSDEYYVDFNLEENIKQDSWVQFGAHISLVAANDRWSVSVIAQNLTDELVATGGNNISDTHDIVYLSAPRTVRLQGMIRF